MSSTILNSLKRGLGYLLMTGLIISGGNFVYSQYPKMTEQVKKMQTPYFESYQFIRRLANSSLYLAYEFQEISGDETGTNEGNFYDELSYWEYTLDRYPAELDYYAVNTDGSHEEAREADLLKQLVTTSDELLWNELQSRYQFVTTVTFDSEGNVSIGDVYGADRFDFERLMQQEFDSYYDHQYDIKNMTFVFGVPQDLPMNGPIYYELNDFGMENYVMVSIPYLIVMALVTILVIFVLPFRWIKESGLVKGLLFVPLEVRFLFVIATCFAIMGAPFLIIATQTGALAEIVQWSVNTDYVAGIVHLMNVFCWSAFIAVIAIHALYVKEFFIIGPWKMLRRHTMIGQLFGLFKKTSDVETVIEERVVYQESPAFALMKERVSSLSHRLSNLQHQLQEAMSCETDVALLEEMKSVQEELQLLLHLSESQSMKTEVNFSKLMADVLAKMPESFNEFELKTKLPTSSMTVLAHQNQLSSVMEQLFTTIATDALANSRVYLEVDEMNEFVQMTLRYVTSHEAKISSELVTWIQMTVENQEGCFEMVDDGDLVKFILSVPMK
ncbi:conserved domain protein [Turicibacter sp. HGF1]|uniref:hypothetical protein n=1 Tax=Turicibacter sp. HGF1 TaxID=910310 RepID=UPI0001FDAFE1|nr:hypothetical protein [Turicibacter sp. HGF1]EGC92338.1 conserved domain protein [Turicibacter sp. HGF1]